MDKKFYWCNNGSVNMRVYSDDIPDGFERGYLCRDKMAKLRKLEEEFQRKLSDLEEKFNKRKRKLEDELKSKQMRVVKF